mmetsp:Transcript_107320/g.335719  ORF Transcript_107320/g.335719 Transcript_107320/m.335719 type:complete len:311 (+) Transcript_107320:849-1781(+)
MPVQAGHCFPCTLEVLLLVEAGVPEAHAEVDVDVLHGVPEVGEGVCGRVEGREEHDEGVPVLPADDVVGLLVEGHGLPRAHGAGDLVRHREAVVDRRPRVARREPVDDLQVCRLLLQEPHVCVAAAAVAAGAAVARGGAARLGALEAVEVQEHPDAVALAPLEEVVEVLQLAFDEGRRREDHPVAEGHAHRVDAVVRQPLDVVLRDPARPVALHPRPGDVGAQRAHEAVLVEGGALVLEGVLPRLVVEEVRRHPPLEEEPVPKVHAADQRSKRLVAARELHLPEGPASAVLVARSHIGRGLGRPSLEVEA